VTAIAGFNCADGVVISADSEETYTDNKVYKHKLFPVVHRVDGFCKATAKRHPNNLDLNSMDLTGIDGGAARVGEWVRMRASLRPCARVGIWF